MTYVRRFFLPALTCLVILTAVLLPKRLSQFQDRQLFDTIHAGDMTADSSLPVWSPDLPASIALLHRWQTETDASSLIVAILSLRDGTLEDLQTAENMVADGLSDLIECGIISEQIFSENPRIYPKERIYLQNGIKSTGAWFLAASVSTKVHYDIEMLLEEETGKILCLSLADYSREHPFSCQEAGSAFLTYLGIEYKRLEVPKATAESLGAPDIAEFAVADTDLKYLVAGSDFQLEIITDFLDKSASANSGYDSDYSKTPLSAYDGK